MFTTWKCNSPTSTTWPQMRCWYIMVRIVSICHTMKMA
jgi:hypothetical protein